MVVVVVLPTVCKVLWWISVRFEVLITVQFVVVVLYSVVLRLICVVRSGGCSVM